MTCTTSDCNQPTDLYLCNQCVSDLQAWIDRVPAMREELFTTMARLDNVRPPNSEGGGGSTEAPLPLNEKAMDMRQALRLWQGQNAKELAKDKYAGGFLSMLQDMIDKAEKIIDLPNQWVIYGPCQAETPDGECERQLKAKPEADTIDCPECGAFHRVTSIIADRAKRSRGEPLPPKEVREFLMKQTKTFVTKKNIENWVMLGHLKYVLARVTTTVKPQRIYYPGDVMTTHFKMKDRRNVS